MTALANLAKQIKNDIDRREASREEWVAATIDLCTHLADARSRFKANKAFCTWLNDNDLGDSLLNHQDRAAAIAMGQHLDQAKPVLEKTERRSLQLIHRKEFKRFTSGSKTTRPKKAKGTHRNPKLTREVEVAIARAVLDEGKTLIEAAAGVGSEHIAKLAVAKELGRREAKADPDIDPATLSMTAQQKLDAAIRQARRDLEVEFERRFQQTLEDHINDVLLPIYQRKAADADRIIKARNGIMSRALYREIKACLHPDRVSDELKARYGKAFNAFTELEIVLCDEKEMPTTAATAIPRSYAAMMALRKKAKH